MRAAAAFLALLALSLAPGALLPAQGGWTSPQPPCELPPPNPKISNAIAALRGAAEKPESRDQQLAQAKRLLTDAILQDKQAANPAAWYSLGCLAVATSDVAGADSALSRALALPPTATERGLASDSTVLARLVASSQSRKARGTRLAPADQQLFTRDSTGRAQAVAQRRAHLAAALGQIAADSSALAAAFAPAIDALSEYVAAYPEEPEAAIALATLYAQSGHAARAAAVFDSLAAHAPALEADALFAPGTRMVEQGMYRAGARALTLGLAKNPYRRDALFSLAVAYYQLRDSASLLPVAQRLLVLDPLNRASLKLVAAGWDFGGRRDSTRTYVARADSGLAVEISVPGFVPDTAGASLSGTALSLQSAPTTPFHLTVEFLDARGQVVATASHDVPSLSPRQSHPFDLQASGRRIAGWRYRTS